MLWRRVLRRGNLVFFVIKRPFDFGGESSLTLVYIGFYNLTHQWLQGFLHPVKYSKNNHESGQKNGQKQQIVVKMLSKSTSASLIIEIINK